MDFILGQLISLTDHIHRIPGQFDNKPEKQLVSLYLEINITQIEASVFAFVVLISQFLENDMFSIEMDPSMQLSSSKGLEKTLTFKISLKRISTFSSVSTFNTISAFIINSCAIIFDVCHFRFLVVSEKSIFLQINCLLDKK